MSLDNERLLSIQDLAKFMGVSREHVRRYIITQLDFPKPIRVMPKAHPRWKYSDILAFIDSKKGGMTMSNIHNEIFQLDERIASVQRLLTYLEKKRFQLFDSRNIQSKDYKLTIDEINRTKQQLNKLKAMRNA